MPYTEAAQKRHEHIYGVLAALRDSNGPGRGSRKSVEVAGTTVTAVRRAHNYTAFEADMFKGSGSMSITECAEYLTAKRPERKGAEPVCPDCEGTRVQNQDFVANKPCETCNGKGTITQHVHLRTCASRA